MKKKLLSFVIFSIITSMIISPQIAHGQSQADSLIEIATKARDQIKIQLTQIDDVSQDLRDKFDRATSEIELIEIAAENDDLPKAREHFLVVMKIFQEISQEISEFSKQRTITNPQTSSSGSDELKRLENYIDRLKEIANRNEVQINFSKAENLINSSYEAFKTGQIDKANSIIDDIKREIIELNNSLREKTRDATIEKAKSFAERHLQELEDLIIQAKEIGVSESTIERLEKAKGDLGDASNTEQIIKEVKHLISVKKEFENNKAERIKSRINQLETKYNELLKTDSKNADLEKARIMILDLITLVSEGELDEAIRSLSSLDNLLKDIENSIESQTKTAELENSDDQIEAPSSLSDSISERIKVKIQRLENEINLLSEKIDDEGAVKRWLENGMTLLENAKSQVENSPESSLEIISKVEQIIKRVERMI